MKHLKFETLSFIYIQITISTAVMQIVFTLLKLIDKLPKQNSYERKLSNISNL